MKTQKLLTADILRRIPALYSTEKVKDPTVHVKLFTPCSDYTWLLTEYDPAQNLAFGYAYRSGHPDGAELGYVSLDELAALRTSWGTQGVERDTSFLPCPLSEAMARECPGAKRLTVSDEDEATVAAFEADPTPPCFVHTAPVAPVNAPPGLHFRIDWSECSALDVPEGGLVLGSLRSVNAALTVARYARIMEGHGDGGYYKTHVTVFDGAEEVYSARFDVKADGADTDIGVHIRTVRDHYTTARGAEYLRAMGVADPSTEITRYDALLARLAKEG